MPVGDPHASADPVFNISRVFAARRDLVWKAWTDPALFAQWFGPKGVTTTVMKFDLRSGGIVHSRMDTPDGQQMWAKFVYREIVEPARLVWVHSFADEHANVARAPFDASWPIEMLTTVRFEKEGDQTKITVTMVQLNATDGECKTFEAGLPSMDLGWAGTFDRLDEFLLSNPDR